MRAIRSRKLRKAALSLAPKGLNIEDFGAAVRRIHRKLKKAWVRRNHVTP